MPLTDNWKYSQLLNLVDIDERIHCVFTDFLHGFDKLLFKQDPLLLVSRLFSTRGLFNGILCNISANLAGEKNPDTRKMIDRLIKRGVTRNTLHFIYHLNCCERCLLVLKDEAVDWDFGWCFGTKKEKLEPVIKYLSKLTLKNDRFIFLEQGNENLHLKSSKKSLSKQASVIEPITKKERFNFTDVSEKLSKITGSRFIIRTDPKKKKLAPSAKKIKSAGKATTNICKPAETSEIVDPAEPEKDHNCIYAINLKEQDSCREIFEEIANLMSETDVAKQVRVDSYKVQQTYQSLFARFLLNKLNLEQSREIHKELLCLRNSICGQEEKNSDESKVRQNIKRIRCISSDDDSNDSSSDLSSPRTERIRKLSSSDDDSSVASVTDDQEVREKKKKKLDDIGDNEDETGDQQHKKPPPNSSDLNRIFDRIFDADDDFLKVFYEITNPIESKTNFLYKLELLPRVSKTASRDKNNTTEANTPKKNNELKIRQSKLKSVKSSSGYLYNKR